MAISISETALRAVGSAEGVSVRRRATACGTLESKLGVHLIAEAADFFPCFLLRRRSERPQRDKPFRSLGLFENLLAIQLGHARVFRRFDSTFRRERAIAQRSLPHPGCAFHRS